MNTYSARVVYKLVLERTIEIEGESEAEAWHKAERTAVEKRWFDEYSLCGGVEEIGEHIETVDISLEEGEEPDEEV